MQALRLDALLVTHRPNIRYLCGFTGSAGVLSLGQGRPALFTDGRYTAQAREEVTGARVVIAKGSPLLAAAQFAQKSKLRSMGIEAAHMTVASRAALRRALGGQARLRDVGPVVEEMRMIKDAGEIALIREAVNLGARLLDTALPVIRPGVAEAEVAAELEYAARRAGAEAMSFETIVAAGPRSAMPHGVASAALIPRRGFVILDFGVILHGYCSDMTRTVHVGKISAGDRSMYNAVREAQQAAVNAVRAGSPAAKWTAPPVTRWVAPVWRGISRIPPATAWAWRSMNRRDWAEARQNCFAPAWWSPSSPVFTFPAEAAFASRTCCWSPAVVATCSRPHRRI